MLCKVNGGVSINKIKKTHSPKTKTVLRIVEETYGTKSIEQAFHDAFVPYFEIENIITSPRNFHVIEGGDLHMKDFGKSLRNARLRKNIQQKIAAGRVGISNVTLSQYEKGIRKPDPETLSKLAEIYETSVDYLIGRTDSHNSSRDLKRMFDEGELHWNGIPLTNEELKPIHDLLEMVIEKIKQDT